MVKFGTLDYFKKYAEAVNKDEQMSKSGFSTTNLIVIENGEEKAFFLNIEDGKITEVREGSPDEKTEFGTRGKYDIWVKVIKGEIDAEVATNKGMLKAKYKMLKALRNRKTLGRLLQIYGEIEAEY
ncbi:MAG: hypothetical protein ACFE7S_08140 [Candidatus Hodarchaeota archaeon]